MAERGEKRRRPLAGARETAKRADGASRLVAAFRTLRDYLPGDSRLGDPMSVTGDQVSTVLARRMSEAGGERPSAVRELGLGAIQVWQALSEAQGRGHGDLELAILFTDIVDFSSWALEAGDDAALDLLRRVSGVVEPIIKEHGGEVVKRLGDGHMAVFTDPQQAVTAARRSCAAVREERFMGRKSQLRAGLHAGQPRKLGGDYIGVDVNIAARLAAEAKPDQILVSAAVQERLDPDAFSLHKQRRFKAKGTPRDIDVFAVA